MLWKECMKPMTRWKKTDWETMNRFLGFSFNHLAVMMGLVFVAMLSLLSLDDVSAVPGTLTISIPDTISLDVLPSASGTFASTSSNITVRTTYAHGYTLGIAAKTANSNALINTNDSSKTIPSITSSVSESDFSSSTSYNNKWGYSPSKYNSATNTNYLVAPTSTTMATLDKTSAANSTDNTYTIKLGARIDGTLAPGTYENTFVFTVTPNATPYTINYNQNTTDTVTNMPTPNPQTGETFATTVNISNTVPARDGYLFKGWCNAQVADGATCSGTTYNPDGGGTSLSWTIDQTAVTNTINLYAMWEAEVYDIVYNLNGGTAGVNSPTSATTFADIVIDNPTKNGYVFTGWTIAGLDSSIHYYGDSPSSYSTSTATSLSEITSTYFKNLRLSPGTVTFDANWEAQTPVLTVHVDNASEECHDVYGGISSNGTRLIGVDGLDQLTDGQTQDYILTSGETYTYWGGGITGGQEGGCSPAGFSSQPYPEISGEGYSIDGPNSEFTAGVGHGDLYISIRFSASCISSDTLITLADGTKVPVKDLNGDEELLVWDFDAGSYSTAPIVFIEPEEEKEYRIIHLYFSDGTNIEVSYEHGFFDYTKGKYIYINENNPEKFIGDEFVKQDGNTYKTVTLTDIKHETRRTTVYGLTTYKHFNFFNNDMLSIEGNITGMFNYFDVDKETMAYDPTKKQADIEKYGLLKYEDFNGMIDELGFEAYNGQYLAVSIGKGLTTWEGIKKLADRYGHFTEEADQEINSGLQNTKPLGTGRLSSPSPVFIK